MRAFRDSSTAVPQKVCESTTYGMFLNAGPGSQGLSLHEICEPIQCLNLNGN
jgi:hypothetical protein